MTTTEIQVHLKRPHEKQEQLVRSKKKRRIGRAGRRSGKTTGIAIMAIEKFLAGRRVLYAAPTSEQIGRFWFEVKQALAEMIDRKILYSNESLHIIEFSGTETRLKAKTAWNADTLRGDYADELILDEWQLMNEEAWELVGAPMLLDNNGDATFLYTPPSLRTRSVSKARDKLHASKMFKMAQEDDRWDAIHFTSFDNPHISREALDEVSNDMTALGFRMEIMAEDIDEVPGALWKRELFVRKQPKDLVRVIVGVDPTGTAGGDEVGIVTAGKDSEGNGYLLADGSTGGLSPREWAKRVIAAYYDYEADRVCAENNFGGDMVEETLRVVDEQVSYKAVHASRGKAVRAEPIAALYEKGQIFHTGDFEALEDEMCTWTPDSGWSPNRIDAAVWALTELMLGGTPNLRFL